MLLAASPAEAGSPRSHALQLAPEWEQAAQRAKERRAAWREVFESLEADPAECEAVVFPELLRYSRVQDGVEQAALLALYVQGGKAKADFSVGMFQMKPSFAEQVETAWMRSPLRHAFKLYFDTADNREQRSRRIRRARRREVAVRLPRGFRPPADGKGTVARDTPGRGTGTAVGNRL